MEQNSAVVQHYFSVFTNYVDCDQPRPISSPLNRKNRSPSWWRQFQYNKPFDISIKNQESVKRNYKKIEVNQISANLSHVLKTFCKDLEINAPLVYA